MKIDKDKLTKQSLTKYKKIFANIEEDKRAFIERLYKEAAFMEATLAELQERINTEGAVTTGTNGNGFQVTQENPATKAYNTMIRNYNGVMKTLVEHVPEETKEDDLMVFIGKGKSK